MDAFEQTPSPPASRTFTVLGLLAVASLVFSYLWAYALTEALIAADVLPAMRPGHDPRPRWLLTGWCTMMLAFMAVGQVLRIMSKRQLDSIDEMEEI